MKSRSGLKIVYFNGSDIKNKIITTEDLKFYEKVKIILQENGVFNPLARLIDNKTYNRLDDNAKERYLFGIVAKYKKYKQKYEEEKERAAIWAIWY